MKKTFIGQKLFGWREVYCLHTICLLPLSNCIRFQVIISKQDKSIMMHISQEVFNSLVPFKFNSVSFLTARNLRRVIFSHLLGPTIAVTLRVGKITFMGYSIILLPHYLVKRAVVSFTVHCPGFPVVMLHGDSFMANPFHVKMLSLHSLFTA